MSIETQGLTLQDTKLIEATAKANAMLRELKPRKGAFVSEDSLYLTVAGAFPDTRMTVEAKREAMFAKTEGWADGDQNGYDEVIVGTGPSAAAWAATAVASGRPRPLAIGTTLGGDPFALTPTPWFNLNSRNRPGEAGLSSEESALNVIPGVPVQGEMLNLDEYQDNSVLAYITRTGLIRYADLRKSMVSSIEFASGSPRRYRVTLEDGVVYADRVIDARGLGMPTKLRSQEDNKSIEWGDRILSVYDFAKRFDQPFPFKGLERVAVIGGGDSGKVVVEALLGIGPNRHMSVPMLDWVEQIDWYGQRLPDDCEDWRQNVRGRYADIGSFLRRPDQGRSRLRVFQERGFVDEGMDKVYVGGRPYDAVIVCVGFDTPGELPGVPRDYGSNVVYGASGDNALGRKTADSTGESGAIYQVGVAANLRFDSADPQSTRRISNNQVALFRNLPRIVQLSVKLKPIQPELVVMSAKEFKTARKVVATGKGGYKIRLGDQVRIRYGDGTTRFTGKVIKPLNPFFKFAVDERSDGYAAVDIEDSFLRYVEPFEPRRRRSRSTEVLGYDDDGAAIREGDRLEVIQPDGDEYIGTAVTADAEYRGYAVKRDDGTIGGGPSGSWNIEEDPDDGYTATVRKLPF